MALWVEKSGAPVRVMALGPFRTSTGDFNATTDDPCALRRRRLRRAGDRPTMPSDDYSAFSGGALKLKGGKVKKHKKKKDKGSSLEKALSTGDGNAAADEEDLTKPVHGDDASPAPEAVGDAEVMEAGPEHDGDMERTETEKRFLEAKRKKVRARPSHVPFFLSPTRGQLIPGKLQEMYKSAKQRPELLKTHKERVEELNSHLSRLSEHHDMPKIGPG